MSRRIASRDSLDVYRLQSVAAKIDPLGNLFRIIRRRQEPGLFEEKIIGRRTVAAGLLHDFVNAAKALGDEEARLGSFFFEQRVSADGGAVTEKRNVARRNPLIDQFLDAV